MALTIATGFQPLTQQEIAIILQKRATAAVDGKFELFRTTSHFDSTAQHPEWLGPENSSRPTIGKILGNLSDLAAGRREQLGDVLFSIEAMFDPATADIVLQVENVVESRH